MASVMTCLKIRNSPQGKKFYNGNLPGFAGVESGWQVINIDEALNSLTLGIEERYNAVLQDLINLQTIEEGANPTDGLTAAEKAQAIDFYSNPEFTSIGFLRQRGGTREVDSYSGETEILAAYLMAKFSGDLNSTPFSGNVGLRYSKTNNQASGITFIDTAPVPPESDDDNRNYLFDNIYEASNPKNSYEKLLPSVNIAFELRHDLVLRAAYHESISRPSLASFRPNAATRITPEEITIDLPESELEPFTADALDLALSWYNRAGSVVSLGVFQKKTANQPIETRLCPADGGDFGLGTLTQNGTSCTQDTLTEVVDEVGVVSLINKDVQINQTIVSNERSTLRGIEATIQQNLDFLPEPFNNLGGLINYSRVTSNGERIIGVSENAYNLVAYYENDNFSTRLSYNYRDDYLLTSESSFALGEREVKARGRLDLSITYNFTDDIKVTLRGFNLLDEIYEEFESNNEALPRRSNYDGRIYSLSANVKFW